MKFYVYSTEDNTHIATITGGSNEACETAFAERFGGDYGATYSPAFGSNDGLIENPDADEIEVVHYKGNIIDMSAARMLMDDDLCEKIHGTVDTDQEFLDTYIQTHEEKFGEEWVFG